MKMLPLVFLSVCFCVCGADFYVDASVSTSGNGSQAAPFATIKAAVDAATLLPGTPSTIHVASGIYNITAASDLVTVSVSKQQSASAVDVSRAVHREFEKMQRQNPTLKMDIIYERKNI